MTAEKPGSREPGESRTFRSALRRAGAVLLAGLAGTLAHTLLMSLKAASGLLPAFQPYAALQRVLAEALLAGAWEPAGFPLLSYALSWFNGAVVAGFVFARVYRRLPGGAGWRRGLAFGAAAWCVMGLAMFPALGLGPFGWAAGGAGAAAFSLAMLLAYGGAMGAAYGALRPDARSRRRRRDARENG